MKRANPGSLIAVLTIALMTGVVPRCAGNVPAQVAADRKFFGGIAANLESGGSFFTILNSAGIRRQLNAYLDSVESRIAESSDAPEKKRELLRRAVIFRMILEISGIKDINGAGASSVYAGKDRWRNRIFVSIPQNSTGLINQIIGRRKIDLHSFAGRLPEDTVLAVAVDISGKKLLDVIKSTGKSCAELLSAFKIPSFPLVFILDNEGVFSFVIVRRSGYPMEEELMRMIIPDSTGKLFTEVARVFHLKISEKDGVRRLNIPGSPVFWRKGQIFAYNGKAAEDVFENTKSRRLNIAKVAAGIPRECCGFMLVRKLSGDQGKASMRNFCGTLSRCNGGFLWCENNQEDIPGSLTAELCSEFLQKLISYRCGSGTSSAAKAVPPAAVPARKTTNPRPAPAINHRKNFTEIFAGLKQFAGQNRGAFPAESGSAGLRKIPGMGKRFAELDKKLFYIGGSRIDSGKNIPVLLSRPEAGKDLFTVLYADGKVRVFKLEHPGCCRRMISFLYTVHRWENKIFQRLIKEAEIIDGNL